MILYLFYALTICSAIFMVLSISPINAVLFLIFVFVNLSIIFILLNIDFLGFIFLMIYVGAVAVLFLFVIMMFNMKKVERDNTSYLTIGSVILMIYLLQFFYILVYNNILYVPSLFDNNNNSYVFYKYHYFDDSNRYMIIKKLGLLLYNEYFPCLIVCGVILFVAMIGAIILTFEKNGYFNKVQHDQLSRNNYIMNTFVY